MKISRIIKLSSATLILLFLGILFLAATIWFFGPEFKVVPNSTEQKVIVQSHSALIGSYIGYALSLNMLIIGVLLYIVIIMQISKMIYVSKQPLSNKKTWKIIYVLYLLIITFAIALIWTLVLLNKIQKQKLSNK